MANQNKKPNAIYEPGELGRVRDKLGDIDILEAKRMAQILGGEVGTEKNRHETVEMVVPGRQGKRPRRVVEVAGDDEYGDIENKSIFPVIKVDPADDPSITLRTSYFERVKMDRYAGQIEYGIKNFLQVMISTLSFLGEPVDYVDSLFVTRRMNMYYDKIVHLVNATRSLVPRHNARRSERLRKSSPFVHSIMETIRYWNVERIGEDLAKIQAHPRSVRVAEFADILRAIYKPLFILEKLDMDIHIKGSYKLVFKLMQIENPAEPKEKNQEFIRTALNALSDIRREVHLGLYPLLMKFISDRWFPYKRLFVDRRRRFMAFLEVTEDDQINPLQLSPEQAESGNLEMTTIEEDTGEGKEGEETDEENDDSGDPKAAAKNTHEAAAKAEQKALDHSLKVLETLFPQAGWERLQEYPDIYPYFANMYGLRNGYELIAPTDPLQQVAILMHIIENLCVALRYVKFGVVGGSDGNTVNVDESIGSIISNWQQYIDNSFIKEYLPRLSDYCRMLEHSPDAKSSVYAKRNMNELRWTKRLYFLPYYKFDSLGPPPFQNREVTAIYSQIKTLRKYLTKVAVGIEQGNSKGGAEAKVPCNGIDNPWARYHFEIPNPVSKRLNVLLGPNRQNNAALIFFALAAVTVLDNLVNSESSWAYNDSFGIVFRSVNGAGVTPMFGVDEKIDADQIFKDTLKQKKNRKP